MKASNGPTRIDTTLGELIEAASEVAFEYSKDPNEAYELTSLVLVEMLKRRFAPGEFVAPLGEEPSKKNYYH